jgi:enamine deaminase RidA (YjgF/YER057c/UK114 family)
MIEICGGNTTSGIDSATGEAAGTNFEAQARQAFQNLEAVTIDQFSR